MKRLQLPSDQERRKISQNIQERETKSEVLKI